MKLPTLALLLLATATADKPKRLNEKRAQRRENAVLESNDSVNWFTSVESASRPSGGSSSSSSSSSNQSTNSQSSGSSSSSNQSSSNSQPSQSSVQSTPAPTPEPTPKPSNPPTPPPTASKFQGLPSLPIQSRMGCPSNQRKLKFEINVDKWGSETTWEIRQLRTDAVVMSNSRTYAPYDEEVVEMCVDAGYPEEQYELILYDEVGDGICCKTGEGHYTLSIEDGFGYDRLVSGGNFKQKKMTHLISVRSQSPPLTPREEEWLVAHNTRRQYWHDYYGKSYVPLKWSGELAASSKAYAEELLSTCGDSGIEHDPINKYGENMAKNKGTGGWGELYSADRITGRFIDREVEIGYPNNYHLTQALWRASKYVGCGESEKPFGAGTCRIQVCRYSKAGNCAMNRDNWEERMMEDDSDCFPDCPPEGCF